MWSINSATNKPLISSHRRNPSFFKNSFHCLNLFNIFHWLFMTFEIKLQTNSFQCLPPTFLKTNFLSQSNLKVHTNFYWWELVGGGGLGQLYFCKKFKIFLWNFIGNGGWVSLGLKKGILGMWWDCPDIWRLGRRIRGLWSLTEW